MVRFPPTGCRADGVAPGPPPRRLPSIVSFLQNLPLDKLTPARLWPALDEPIRRLAVQALYGDDRELRGQADAALADALRFRPAGIRKLPVDKRVDYFVRRVRPDDPLASTLLTTLHLAHRRPLLGGFLDALDIPNDDGLIQPGREPGPVAADRLAPAVDALRKRFDPSDVDVYLASLLALDPDTWGGLRPLLEPDAAA